MFGRTSIGLSGKQLVVNGFISFFIIHLLSINILSAQNVLDTGLFQNEKSKYLFLKQQKATTQEQTINVGYVNAHWNINPAVKAISGNVYFLFKTLKPNIESIQFELNTVLVVDSITTAGQKLTFNHSANDVLTISLLHTLNLGDVDSVNIYYHGEPPSGVGFGSFIQTHHGPDPIIWTLSEPYGAKDWWPCKQNLTDKIDSIDVYITHPKQYTAVSNGILINTITVAENTTTHWRHRYPIATYLVALAVTHYANFEQQVIFNADTTKILNYVYPEDSVLATAATTVVFNQMLLYDTLFGVYPFHTEKYGHAQFGWGGGMEHQTISFMGGYTYDLFAHELAHQWFGNKVTCNSWQDIWLNEGFATYLTGLCYEHLVPVWWAPYKKDLITYITHLPDGSVFCTDTTSVSRIFNSRLTYYKGAMILHTLRWVMGDSAFYAGTRAYLNDPFLSYGFGSFNAFKAHMEEAFAGDLTWYFNDWYYGEGFPTYSIQWGIKNEETVNVKITQTQSHPSVKFYELPVPIRFKNVTHDTTVVLQHNTNGQTFFVDLGFQPDSAFFDPENWIISKNNSIAKVVDSTSFYSWNIFPNPFVEQLNIVVHFPEFKNASINIVNMLGQVVYTTPLTTSLTTIGLNKLRAGCYTVVLNNNNTVESKYILKL